MSNDSTPAIIMDATTKTLLAAGDGGVSEVEGLVRRVHNDRWGRTAQTKEVDLRRALRGRAGGSEEGPLRADYFLAVLAMRLARKRGGLGRFKGASGLPQCPG